MQTPDLIAIEPEQTFRFACHCQVPCFNHCCQNLNQALTPYDVLRLKSHLNVSSKEFIGTYAMVYTGSSTGLPVASLRFGNDTDKQCPFVTPQGCSVYPARPSSCRIYPLARALRRNRSDGRVSEDYAIIREAHCRGFEEPGSQTVRQWIADQQLDVYLAMNDAMMELIALKNQMRPGPLSPEHLQLVRMAFYNPEGIQNRALGNELPEMNHDHLKFLPDIKNDEAWLKWSIMWIGQVLFGKHLNM
jgi:Fe-S-cluster containining protein